VRPAPEQHAVELARGLDEIDQRLRSELAEVGEVFIDVTARGGGRDHAGAGL
jgi:hypothetical protein